MKKKLLIAALLMGSYFTANAQVTIFEDNFDGYEDFIISNIGEWTQIDVDGAPTYGLEVYVEGEDDPVTVQFANSGYTGTGIIFNQDATNPALEGYEAHSGAKSLSFIAAVSENEEGPTGPNNDWVITPQLMLGSTGNTLRFWAKSVSDTWGLERFRVAISTTGNTSPADFTTISAGSSVEAPLEWTEYTYSLDSYAGQEVYIAINYVSDDSFVMQVDDFMVTAATLGVSDHLASQFSVFPNPATNVVNITNAENILVTGVSIADINGRTVKSMKFDGAAEAQINISDLASGMYLMNIASDKGTTTKKVIKN